MGLVDYASDSGSDSGPEPQAAVAPPPSSTKLTVPPQTSASLTGKKPFQKLLDRSDPGRILVSLPTDSKSDSSVEPPAKRARTSGESAFAGFNSFLPAPKNTAKQPGKQSASKPIALKTGPEAAFTRDGEGTTSVAGFGLPPPKNGGPMIPEGQKSEDEVKLVGKPLMFKPLSVARRPGSTKKVGAPKPPAPKLQPAAPDQVSERKAEASAEEKKPKKEVPLFSFDEPANEPGPAPASGAATYEPLIATEYSSVTGVCASETETHIQQPAEQAPARQAESLTALADTMNLSAAERRELFGRAGPSAVHSAATVVNLNMDREYAANEALRASGEVVQHNPVRGIAPGKHSLKQLVNAVQSQRAALEESFAKGKSTRKEAAGRYGWK